VPFTFYIIAMTDMLCFINNYLEDLPKDLQLTIMEEKHKKDIIDIIEMVYEKSCYGDHLYMDIENLIRWNTPCCGDKEPYEDMIDELKNLFTEKQWDLIYKYEMYNAYIETLDLEGIDTPIGFD